MSATISLPEVPDAVRNGAAVLVGRGGDRYAWKVGGVFQCGSWIGGLGHILEREGGQVRVEAALRTEIESRLSRAPRGAALTDMEMRVAVHLPSRMTVAEIARHMHVSPNTIKTHVSRIYMKLGAVSRAQAVAIMAARRREEREAVKADA